MSLIVSVSGVRGLVGESLTPDVVLEFARAYGTLLDGGRVAVGRDTRPSGEMFTLAAAAGLMAAGCEVTMLGIAMTPTIAHAIRAGGFDGGIIVTASHNPGQWNGMKLLDNQGLAPDPARAARIAEIREQQAWRTSPTEFAALLHDEDAGERHVEAVIDAVEVDLATVRGMRVVLDSVNGAGAVHSAAFLSQLGCDVVHINAEPNGRFAHEPEPLRENLAQLCQAVRDAGAAAGFAQDPDADRLVVIDERGEYVGEEYTLALAAESALSRRTGPLAANLSTSRMIDDVAARHGVRVYRTPVGEAHVARAILANGCVLGGEGNGGVIDARISPVRDSLSAMSHILQLMAATGKPLSQLAAAIPSYTMIKRKFTCPRERAAEAIAAVERAFAGKAQRSGTGATAAGANAAGAAGVRFDKSDGIRIDTPEGWVHLRASNTEPIVRLIAEARDEPACERLIAQVASAAGITG